MHKDIKLKLDNWKFHRDLALDILKSLNEEQLSLTVGKNMGTLGEQFRHMARVQIQYTEAVKNKKIGPTEKKTELAVALSKEKLFELWEEAEKNMTNLIGSLPDQDIQDLLIDWIGKKGVRYRFLRWRKRYLTPFSPLSTIAFPPMHTC